jgi:hypothetical protein
VGTAFHFNAATDTKQRHAHVAAEATARGTAQRHPFGCEAVFLQ